MVIVRASLAACPSAIAVCWVSVASSSTSSAVVIVSGVRLLTIAGGTVNLQQPNGCVNYTTTFGFSQGNNNKINIHLHLYVLHVFVFRNEHLSLETVLDGTWGNV